MNTEHGKAAFISTVVKPEIASSFSKPILLNMYPKAMQNDKETRLESIVPNIFFHSQNLRWIFQDDINSLGNTRKTNRFACARGD
jgi:hypothetical protein